MASTWHTRSERRPKRHRRRPCLHCEEWVPGAHYLCTEARPCQDCMDDALTVAEDIAAGYGPGTDWDDDSYDRDSDLEHPWNFNA